MKQGNKNCAGVWIDNQHALLITETTDEGKNAFAVSEKIKAAENFGGGSEHSMNNAKQSGALKYYKSIASKLTGFSEILLFGPGKAQEQFQNHLQEDVQFKNKKISIDSGNDLTEPQIIAKVRDHFA